MHALRTYQRAVDRYGWVEAMRRAPRAVVERARGGLGGPRSSRERLVGHTPDDLRTLLAGAGLEPADVVVVSDALFGSQVIRKRTSDWPTYRQIFLQHDWRLKGTGRPKTIIDLGANVGYSTVWYHVTFPAARIVAIEPDSGNVAMARVNIALGCAGADVTLEQSAIWHTESWLKISNPNGKECGFQVTEADDGERGAFRATTMGSIMNRHHMDTVDLVKFDIEASERSLFGENTDWLDRVDAVAIELHDRMVPGCREAVLAALDRHFVDYDEVGRGENTLFTRRQRLPGPRGC